MNKIILILVSVAILAGCRSVPRRDLSTREGIIAAHFTVPVKDVRRLFEKGYTEEESVGILFISAASHLEEKEVIKKLKQGQQLKDIAVDAGIDKEKYEEKTSWLLSRIDEYSEEKQVPEEE